MPRITSEIGAALKGNPYSKEEKYYMLMPLNYKYFSYTCYAMRAMFVMSATHMGSYADIVQGFNVDLFTEYRCI